MDADAEAEREGQEEQQARVAGAAPTEHEPHIERAEEHGHGVDLALDGGEPHRVAEEVAEGADSGTQAGRAQFAEGTEEHHDGQAAAEGGEGAKALLDEAGIVDTDGDERLMRIIRRDIAERGRTWEDVLRHYQTFVKPMHQQFIEPTKRTADIILPRGSSPVVVDILASRIRMHLGK